MAGLVSTLLVVMGCSSNSADQAGGAGSSVVGSGESAQNAVEVESGSDRPGETSPNSEDQEGEPDNSIASSDEPSDELFSEADCDPSGSFVDQEFEFELNVDLSLPEEWRREFIQAMDNLQELAPISNCIFFLPEGNPMRSPLSVYAWSSEVSNPWPDERPGMSGACICGDGSTRWMALEINADEFKNDLLHRYAVIAHEYFHVFQIARSGDLMKPVWLVEGGAKTFEELFTKTYYGASEFDNGLFPVTANGLEDPSIFEKYVNVEGDRNYNFSSFMVLVLVNELKKIQGLNEREALRLVLADYWSNLQGRSSWQEVFEETFGMTASDVYEAVQAFKTEKSRKPWYSGDVVAVDEVQNLMPTGTLTLQDIFGSP